VRSPEVIRQGLAASLSAKALPLDISIGAFDDQVVNVRGSLGIVGKIAPSGSEAANFRRVRLRIPFKYVSADCSPECRRVFAYLVGCVDPESLRP
jgi:hypothetical protein